MIKKSVSNKGDSRLDFEDNRGILLKSKRSQITIFIIIAILIIGAIALVFLIMPKSSNNISADNIGTISSYIDNCATENALKLEKEIIKHSGLFNITGNSMVFNGSKIAFFCYTNSYDVLCNTEYPVLTSEIEEQIYDYLKQKLDKCFENVGERLSKYNYKEEPMVLSVEILPDKIKLNINKKITYTINEQTKAIENFNTAINSPLFEFIRISQEIVNQEVNCDCPNEACNADINLLNKFNHADFEITKPLFNSRKEEVYSISEKLSGKQFNFAVKNCVSNSNPPL
jgi:hypothetical protein